MRHLAIILDGNRRWAREQGLSTFDGHRRGHENVKTIGLSALERGVEYFSVFAFSTENWKRTEEEVGYIMELLLLALTKELDFFLEHNVRVRVVGHRVGLSKRIQEAIGTAEQRTAGGTRGQINLCLNYGGRAEIVEGVKKLLEEGHAAEVIDETRVGESLWTAGIPDPDMIVRTGGEQRLSGFLTWSGVYSELKFVDKYWPDFSVEDLDECLKDFEQRQRRFGK
ncbi:MAG: Isoprenyl transferase [Candidatus Uhrbacteria bacterium GW2011_GWA2_52_8d]|uniref:Isoprenyl transferase n=1 Tax=Candidatus Uhrbacteria bacterium GW2011_GWA2_52_8d TaxID=1618979 RepID=A0A0G1XRA8_9BACT|nr:MAG: Isoprenyl transferase [Candidatus Uhrbacteria bacterium GW2011_GWA2_52_8d]